MSVVKEEQKLSKFHMNCKQKYSNSNEAYFTAENYNLQYYPVLFIKGTAHRETVLTVKLLKQ